MKSKYRCPYCGGPDDIELDFEDGYDYPCDGLILAAHCNKCGEHFSIAFEPLWIQGEGVPTIHVKDDKED